MNPSSIPQMFFFLLLAEFSQMERYICVFKSLYMVPSLNSQKGTLKQYCFINYRDQRSSSVT